MFRKGTSSEAQFNYWNLRRGGKSQSEISREFNITRQSVSKSVKVQEREVVIRLLEWAQASGILPIFYDQVLGVLIGTIPPLGNIKCFLIIDDRNDSRVFYDPKANPDEEGRNSSRKDLISLLTRVLDTDRFKGMDFNDILDEIMMFKRGD